MDLSGQFEVLYGMLATHAEYEVGERICYRCEDETIRTGTVMWIVAPDRIADRHVPTRYVVKCDADTGLPDTVWQRDILEIIYRYVLKPVVDIAVGDSIYLWGDNCEVVKVDEPGLYGITLEVYYNGELREVWYRLDGVVYICIRSF